MRSVIGVGAGIATGAAFTWFLKDSSAGVFAGALVGITVRFWAWGPVAGGRRG
jgi:hypothetical protein